MRSSTADDTLAERLAAATEGLLAAQSTAAQALAQRGYERIVYLGSGPLTGLARESALKLLELTAGAVIAYSNSALGFRHGPKAVLDNRTLALVYLSNDPYTRQYDLDIAAELRAALDPESVVVISAADEGGPWHIPGLSDVDDVALALPFVVCAQLLGLHFSLAMGTTPDNPFPSGTVNRVVQGVTIHTLGQSTGDPANHPPEHPAPISHRQ
jgi:tagatose-6-phosphate ketose/aldose isomerase